jgi:hypothetical protein
MLNSVQERSLAFITLILHMNMCKSKIRIYEQAKRSARGPVQNRSLLNSGATEQKGGSWSERALAAACPLALLAADQQPF